MYISPCGKWRATDACVDSIEDLEADQTNNGSGQNSPSVASKLRVLWLGDSQRCSNSGKTSRMEFKVLVGNDPGSVLRSPFSS